MGCVYHDHDALGAATRARTGAVRCEGPLSIFHDTRGCRPVCDAHRRWRGTLSQLLGHSPDCPVAARYQAWPGTSAGRRARYAYPAVGQAPQQVPSLFQAPVPETPNAPRDPFVVTRAPDAVEPSPVTPAEQRFIDRVREGIRQVTPSLLIVGVATGFAFAVGSGLGAGFVDRVVFRRKD